MSPVPLILCLGITLDDCTKVGLWCMQDIGTNTSIFCSRGVPRTLGLEVNQEGSCLCFF